LSSSAERGRFARKEEPPLAWTSEGSGRSRIWLALRSDPSFWIGGSIVLAVVLFAVLAPLVAPHDPDLAYRVRDGGLTPGGDPVGPTGQFPLGTDRLGRDYLSRLLFGARTSLTVGLVANGLATLVGLVVGSLAGFAGNPPVRLGLGRYAIRVRLPIETALMRATDAVLAMPALLLAIALAAVIGPSLALVTFVIAGLLWTTTARIVYGRVLDVKRRDFIQAAEAIGVSPARILIRHVLPHVLPVVVVYGTLGIAATVLFETSLSYLGVGVPPPTPSWGTMIADHISYYATQPRLVILPGLAIMLTILAFNLLGDALRDALDPNLSGTRRAATDRSGRS
jgi:peptide/nickel transport system permease protein